MHRRVILAMSCLGLSIGLVAGMPTSGVASASRFASAGLWSTSQPASSFQATAPQPPDTRTKVGQGKQITRAETKQETLGLRALALVTYPWQQALPGWQIRFLPARKGYLAITYRVERRIDVYVRMDRPVEGVAHDIAHELGHAIDVSYLNDETRAEFLALRSLKATTPWWACDGCTDLQTGAGDFAECFALIAAPRYKFYSRLGDEPTAEQLAKIETAVLPDL
jgi:hypothetical protein